MSKQHFSAIKAYFSSSDSKSEAVTAQVEVLDHLTSSKFQVSKERQDSGFSHYFLLAEFDRLFLQPDATAVAAEVADCVRITLTENPSLMPEALAATVQEATKAALARQALVRPTRIVSGEVVPGDVVYDPDQNRAFIGPEQLEFPIPQRKTYNEFKLEAPRMLRTPVHFLVEVYGDYLRAGVLYLPKLNEFGTYTRTLKSQDKPSFEALRMIDGVFDLEKLEEAFEQGDVRAQLIVLADWYTSSNRGRGAALLKTRAL